MKPKICIITVNWNSFEVISENLDSLREMDYDNFVTVVVDNGSSDNSVSLLRERYPEVILLEAGKNMGLTGANNIGLRYALEHAADYCLILNNDTVSDPWLLRELVSAAEKTPRAAAYGAKIFYYAEPSRIWWGRTNWDRKRATFQNKDSRRYEHETDARSVENIDFANGCALFIRTSVLPTVGLMDERFFVYFEEVDWCFRARRCGHSILFVPSATLRHKVAVSSGGQGSAVMAYYEMRNQLLWARKNLPFGERVAFCRVILWCFFPATFSKSRYFLLRRLYWDTVSCFTPKGKAQIRGFIDYLLGRFGECPHYVYALNKAMRKDTP